MVWDLQYQLQMQIQLVLQISLNYSLCAFSPSLLTLKICTLNLLQFFLPKKIQFSELGSFGFNFFPENFSQKVHIQISQIHNKGHAGLLLSKIKGIIWYPSVEYAFSQPLQTQRVNSLRQVTNISLLRFNTCPKLMGIN